MRRTYPSLVLGALALAAACAPSALQTAERADGAIRLTPQDDFNEIVADAPAGTRFVLADGVYRGWQVEPRDDQAFVAEGDRAVLDGSIVVDGWRQEGGHWVADIPPTQWNHGEVREGRRAQFREDLFADEQLLRHVDTPGELAPDSWMRDGDEARVAFDPRGRFMELSYTENAFASDAANVLIEGLTVRQYAPSAQAAAIEGNAGRAWRVVHVIAEHNHSRGLTLGHQAVVEGGCYCRNGQLGIGGSANGATVRGTVIAHNNYAGYDSWWEAGGFKIVQSDDLTLAGNIVHSNDGPGVWLDWDNRFARIENNLIARNQQIGVQIEASRQGVVRGNVIARNGQNGYDVGFWGAELLLQNSGGYEVTGNTIVVEHNKGIGVTQQDRGGGDYGEHLAVNNRVTGNTVVYLDTDGASGAWADHRPELVFASTTFDGNHYVVPSGSADAAWFENEGSHLDWEGVRSTGWETSGTLETADNPSAHEPDYAAWRAPDGR